MEVVEAHLGGYVPPADSTIVGIAGENSVVDDREPVDWHSMPDEHPQLFESLIVDLVQPYTVVVTGQHKLDSNNFANDHRYAIPAYLLLVPVEDSLVLVTSDKNVIQDGSEHYRTFVVAVMSDNHRHRLPFEEDAAGSTADKDG